MTTAALLTALVIALSLALMMANVATPDIILLGGVVFLAAAGVISPTAAFEGFGNTGMLTVAALFVVAAALRETGAVTLLTARLLGQPKGERAAIARLTLPVVFASAFLNNTTIVATLLPAVNDWARRLNMAPSRLLMPLSFASILGGTCTLIGTSTNLVVAGLVAGMLDQRADLHALTLFEISPVGIPVAIAGGLLMIALGPRLLPDRRRVIGVGDDPRQYTMELIVPPGSRLVGRTIEEAGLRQLPGAFLMEIIREGEVLTTVDGHQRLRTKDRLVLVGDVPAMVELQRLPGVEAAAGQVFKMEGDRLQRHIVEAVVAERNPLVGKSIREGAFRSRYAAVVIAVARAGERLGGRLGDIILRPGDVLLLEADPRFLEVHRTRNEFYLVSSVEGATPPRTARAPVAIAILTALIAAITFDLLSTVVAAFIAAGAMVLTRCCTLPEARRALDLQVLIAIAAAFGLGHAMQTTGLDVALADLTVRAGADSPLLALIAIYVITTLLTEVVTNNAAAVLAVPLAISLADQLGAAPMGYIIVVMMAASASFLSPIGYQTNLMVFSAGGYRASDFPRLGLPMSIVVAVVTLAIVPFVWPLTK